MENPIITQLTEKVKQLSQLNETLCQTNKALANTCEIQANQIANILSKNVEKSTEVSVKVPIEKPLEKSVEDLPKKGEPNISTEELKHMCQFITEMNIYLDKLQNKLLCVATLSDYYTLDKFIKYFNLQRTDDRSSWAYKHVGMFQDKRFAISVETYLSYIKPHALIQSYLDYKVIALYETLSSSATLSSDQLYVYNLLCNVKNAAPNKITMKDSSPTDEVKQKMKKVLTDDEKKQMYSSIQNIKIKYDNNADNFFCLIEVESVPLSYQQIITYFNLVRCTDDEHWQYKHCGQYSGWDLAISVEVFMKEIKPYVEAKPYIDSMNLDVLSSLMKKYTL